MNLRTNLLLVTILALSGSSGAVQALGQQQWMTPAPVTEVNTEYEEWAPFISFDGLSLYFSRVRTGSFYYGRIYQARRDELSGPFTSVIEISELNEPDTHILCPWVSPDNLRMYYHKEHGGRFSLAVSKRASVNDLWPKGTDIPELNVLSDRVVMPRLTADELTIFFGAYGVTAGQQEWDIWIATRADKNSPFDSGVTTSTAISSPFMDQAPSPSPDGLILYLASSRNDGNTSQLFRATRHSLIEPFVNVEHLSFFDTPGGHTYHPCISSDGTALYFMRQLGEDRSTRDIYVSYYIAAGRDYYVDAVKGQDNNDGHSPSAAFATIQKGIDSAQNGDKVTVYPGTYFENINFNGKNITLTSTDANNPDIVAKTVINGSQNGSVVTFNNGESADCVLTGFTITNGQSEYGGGIYIDGTSPTLANCTISGNYAEEDGGGICISYFGRGNPTFTNCLLNHNSASDRGGGMCNTGGKAILTNCAFCENSAGEGGGIWTGWSDTLTLISCIFEHNSASRYGGGLYGDPFSGGPLTITRCTIAQNSANDGGGIEIAHRPAKIENSFIVKNSAAGNGGGIHSVSALLTLTNSVINENTASEQGGAVFFSGGLGEAFVTNCTFVKNTAAQGRTIACVQEPDMCTDMKLIHITNSILWNGGDEIQFGDNFTITVTYSDVQGGWPGEGNINADPRFAGLPEGFVAHWKFDEQQGHIAYDSVGDNHGTIRGAQRTTGWLGGALSFDGVDDYVSLSGNAVTSTEFTVSAWANHRGVGGGRNNTNMIFSQRDDDATPASRSIIVLATERLRDSPYTFAGIQSSPGVLQELTHPKKDYNEWHHYAMTVNTSDFILYIDGLEVSRAANNQKGDYVTLVDYVDIGRHRYFQRDNGFFNGVIDEVAVWDRALSAEEIRRAYLARSYYELLPDSPCINAGDPYGDYSRQTDIDGQPRVIGGCVDIGADEFLLEAQACYYVDAKNGSDLYDGLSPQTAFATIQKGIDSAQNGDKAIVYPGTYRENVHFNGKNITLTSTDPNNPAIVAATIIDGGQKGSVVTFKSGEGPDCTLNGFTVTNGQAGQGGGVYCTGSSPHLFKCTFSRNSAAAPGGGMFASSGNPTLTDCTFNENSATWGGGFFCEPFSGPTLVRCKFTRNSATSGGAIFCELASIVITSSLFSENAATQGAAILAYSDADVFIANCTFIGNKAADGATLACKSGTGKGKVTLLNSILWNGGNEIWLGDKFTITVTYSDVQGGWPGEGNINANPRFAGLPEGLVSYLAFDEQQGDIAHDSVGDNHGTIYGAQWTAGKNDGGLDFDGDRDYVWIGDKDSLEPQQLTLSVWAKLDNPSGLFQGGIAKGYMFGAVTDYSYQLKFHDGCAEARVTYTPGGACGITCPIGDNNWHLWTMTTGRGNISIYKDGAYAGSSLFSGAIDYAKSNSNFVIGARDNGMHAFDGIMDDVMLFNRVLSAEEIRQLYSGQFNSYHLLPGSPCIDAGDPAYVPQPDEIDLYGSPRVMGTAIDMGAVEFQPLGLIELSVDKFEFEATVGFPNPADQILIVRNAGPGTLNWQISYDCDWLQVQPDSGRSKGEGNTAWLGVNTTGLSAGEYNCTLTVSGSPASNSPQIVQVGLIVRKSCFPDTPQYAQQYADFLNYAAYGADPGCWCASWSDGTHYQCDGDASGRKQTFTNYRVFTDDLALIIKSWKKKIDTADPCADIDHKAQLFQRYRVFTNDLCMLITNWKKRDDQLANNCPRPDGQ